MRPEQGRYHGGGEHKSTMATATLMILGRPVSFAVSERCRIEGCRSPLHPGPCKGWKPKKVGYDRSQPKTATPTVAPKKAVAKKAAPKKPASGDAPTVQRGADKAATDAARAEEV